MPNLDILDDFGKKSQFENLSCFNSLQFCFTGTLGLQEVLPVTSGLVGSTSRLKSFKGVITNKESIIRNIICHTVWKIQLWVKFILRPQFGPSYEFYPLQKNFIPFFERCCEKYNFSAWPRWNIDFFISQCSVNSYDSIQN